MALFSLILELLADATMLLSAPHLLDRILARLCERSFLRLSLRGGPDETLLCMHRSMDVAVGGRHRIAAFRTCSRDEISDGRFRPSRITRFSTTQKTTDLWLPMQWITKRHFGRRQGVGKQRRRRHATNCINYVAFSRLRYLTNVHRVLLLQSQA